jgi:hypothetical protein
MASDVFMELELEALPIKQIRSHYRQGRPGFPARMGFMHPACVEAFIEMQEAAGWNIVLTDAWRAALMSLKRKYPEGKPMRRGTQPPAYSGHNYGFSIDIDTSATLKRMKMTKRQLDTFMREYGFVCHRLDHRRGSEDWHYNALVLGKGFDHWMKYAGRRTSSAVERMIKETYGKHWKPTNKQIQRYMKFLKLYPGRIDGDMGPMSKTAVRAFQRAWKLAADGAPGPKTCRVLSFRCAELRNDLINDLWTVTG